MNRPYGVLTALLIVACSTTPTTAALIDLPDLEVLQAPSGAGAPVQLQLVNSTPDTVTIGPVGCGVSIEQFTRGNWVVAREAGSTCVGLVTLVVPEGSHPFIAEMPAGTGRFRAVLRGGSEGGRAFRVHSPAFDVE